MTAPNETPIRFSDGNVSECAICGETIVAGTDLCLECDPMAEEWRDFCRPDECRHTEDAADAAAEYWSDRMREEGYVDGADPMTEAKYRLENPQD